MNNLPAEKENSLDSEVSLPNQDEYLNPDDQLIYCSKCHTPKQMWIEPNILFSESRKVPVRCACRKKEHELAKQAKEQQERDDLVRRLYQSSCFPAGLRECTFSLAEPYHQDALVYAKDYAEKLIEDPAFSKGILFYGPPGTGKTYTAACIANHLIQSLQPVLHASVGYILSEYNACKSFSETAKNPADYLNDLLKYRLIILDDLGSEYQSAYHSCYPINLPLCSVLLSHAAPNWHPPGLPSACNLPANCLPRIFGQLLASFDGKSGQIDRTLCCKNGRLVLCYP